MDATQSPFGFPNVAAINSCSHSDFITCLLLSTVPVMTNSSPRIALVLLAATIFSTSILHTPVRADDADSDFTFAAGFYRKNRWQYSADAFKKFLDQYPEHPRATMARLYYGLSLNSLEKYVESREQLQLFVKADPRNRYAPDARYRIAEDSYYLKNYAEAITEFGDYLTDHPGHELNAWARLLQGESHNRLKGFVEAEAVLRPLIALPPPANILADSNYALAEALQGQSKLKEAADLYETIAEMKSDGFSHKALFRLAGILYDNEDFGNAALAYDRIVSEFSDKPLVATAALQAGVARFKMKQYQEAYSRFDQVPATSEVRRYVGLWKGLCLRDAGRLPEARTVFAAAFTEAGDTPLAAEIMFHRAQLEAMDNKNDVAAQMYLDLTARWPQDVKVPVSLFNAAELHMESQQLDAAQGVLNQLETDFPERSKSAAVMVLRGRLLLNQGKTDDSVTTLRAAVAIEEGSSQEKLAGNYHLIRALHRAKKYDEAIAIYEPLQQEFSRPEASNYSGAVSLAAISSLELKKYAQAWQYADAFLQLESQPEKLPDALATRAVAASHLNEFDKAKVDLERLTKDFPRNSQTWMAVLQSAEAAWQQENYAQSAGLFELAAQHDDKRDLEAALSGAGWSYYRLGNFKKADELFGRILTSFPDSVEAAYMQAMSLQKADNSAAAASRFKLLFEKLQQNPDAAMSPEKVPYFLDSGRMSARLLELDGQVDQADQMWDRLATTFAASPELDNMLDEWARMNLKHQRYERSDEIYGRLIKDLPNSRFSGTARLSLAESKMQANHLDAALNEFIAISMHETYADQEKEAALFHVVDIYAAQQKWPDVIKSAEQFVVSYETSEHAPMVRLLHADGLLDQRKFADCRVELDELRTAVLNQQIAADEWTERIWVVLAELALVEKRYADIDATAEELESRVPTSRLLFQIRNVQGKRWKSQAPPDFARSRDYLLQVVQDEHGKGTETAARSQFLIAETLLMEKNYAAAAREFYRVYLNYPFVELRAGALLQAAQCEMELKQTDQAIRSLEDLIADFPKTEYAETAKARLKELTEKK